MNQDMSYPEPQLANFATEAKVYNCLNIFHHHVGFEVFVAVTMKNAIFWYVAPSGFIIN
jgi:hypothetical protein